MARQSKASNSVSGVCVSRGEGGGPSRDGGEKKGEGDKELMNSTKSGTGEEVARVFRVSWKL